MRPSKQAAASEFLVEFAVDVPDGTPESELEKRPARRGRRRPGSPGASRRRLEAAGHVPGETKILGLYRASSKAELDALLGGLPLYEWMNVTVTPLEPHPNDPATRQGRHRPGEGCRTPA